ncbi:hypothetical protein AXF42_Ash005769 [Apostasia shenzhenica]|uniref:Uncharacterized protein n=1 Tax=Apostasia shenzhenica TaxID=1088818 RepID=A0A2I0BCB9_9ASPA|nr:hypothetical protein AXF42_Ash005769 [Apostasia shenzhenica]
MGSQRLKLLSRLRRAIDKVRFLLAFDLRRWLLSSSAARSRRRRLESRPRSPGLLDCSDAVDEPMYYCSLDMGSPPAPRTISPFPASQSSPPLLVRTISRAASGSSATSEDINQRADDFIESFYRQLRMERQISLKLRYCAGDDD